MAQTTKGATSTIAIDQMEITNVLAQYLELFSYDCNQFKFYMAPNGVVDWFGRCIRGPAKIHEYLRNEVCPQYEHLKFENAEECEPIEHKPAHLKTKIAPKRERDLDHIHPINRVTGITTLKSYADSDVDDDDGDVEMLSLPVAAGNNTPPRSLIEEQLTPPASTSKQEQIETAYDSNEEDEDCTEIKAKRLKLMQKKPFSYLRRLPTSSMSKRKANLSPTAVRTLLDDTSSEEEEEEEDANDTEEKYTPLHYIEMTGVLRSQSQPKHRGVGGARQSSTPMVSNASATNDANAGSWDREVRIRISYRIRKTDQQLQFALIIYEHLEARTSRVHTSRRNLMLEFSQPADEEAYADEHNTTTTAAEEQHVFNAIEETTIATVSTPTTEEIAAALETAAFTIVPLRTPTKHSHTPPATPKRKPRLPHSMSAQKRLNLSPSPTTPKRSAARSLRL